MVIQFIIIKLENVSFVVVLLENHINCLEKMVNMMDLIYLALHSRGYEAV